MDEKFECAVIEASVSVGPGVRAYAFPLEISRFHTPNFDIYGPNNGREILAKYFFLNTKAVRELLYQHKKYIY